MSAVEEEESPQPLTEDNEYSFDDWNVHLVANGERSFFVHYFKLESFSTLKPKMDADSDFVFLELPDSAEDIHNTFRIIYACPLESPKFDVDVLISALRIATAYDYPKLRQFAIKKLEEEGLPCFEHLSLAREYGIPGWENVIMDQLVAKADPITLAEAQVLGLDLFVSLVTRRETKSLPPPKSTFHEAISPAVEPRGQKDNKSRRTPEFLGRDYPAPRGKVASAMKSRTKPSEPSRAPNSGDPSGGTRQPAPTYQN
ncbi:hypothetical protein BDV93DRAFT_557825 [Ceratobasidium sp. AG-I]|nr:hypothetical protein BDV93DRAFT_557825 [Ceratobasidium sp. AG-I]